MFARLSYVKFVRNVVAIAIAIGFATLIAAIPSRAAETTHLYIGRVTETNAFVAITTDGETVKAFICDGTADAVSLWGWFDGRLGDSVAELVSTNGLVLRIEGVDDQDGVVGRLILRDGATVEFTAAPASGAAAFVRDQGLVDGNAVLAGWIILPDGDQRGAAIKNGSLSTVNAFADRTTNPDDITEYTGCGGGRYCGGTL